MAAPGVVVCVDDGGPERDERTVRRLVVLDDGVHAAQVPAPVQRARVPVLRAPRPVVFPQFLHAVPLLTVAPDGVRRRRRRRHDVPVLAPQPHGRHRPVENRMLAAGEQVAARAPPLVPAARRAHGPRAFAQPVRRQRLLAAAVTRHQIVQIRAQQVHCRGNG